MPCGPSQRMLSSSRSAEVGGPVTGGQLRQRRIAGSRRVRPPASRLSRLSRWFTGIVATVLATVLVGWLTPLGSGIWNKLFPPPDVSASIVLADPLCDPFVIPGTPKSWGPSPHWNDL